MAKLPDPLCLSWPDCGVCPPRQAARLPSGFIAHVTGPDQAAEIINGLPRQPDADSAPEAGG